MIDVSKIRHGSRVTMDDGTKGVVKGSYVSVDGLVLRVLQTGGIVQRNVPIGHVTEVTDARDINKAEELHASGTVTQEGGTADENPDVGSTVA